MPAPGYRRCSKISRGKALLLGGCTQSYLRRKINDPCDSNIVVCYEVKDGACKCFNLSRIGYVELTDRAWAHKPVHRTIKVDAFHMSGEKKIHCRLELNLMARNLLIEEFPNAKDNLKKKGDMNLWELDIDVYKLEGIARFYLGLANCIRIIDAPELKSYVSKFVNDNLKEI